MPRPFKGQIIERAGGFSLRVTLSKNVRPCVALPTCTTREQATERSAILLGLADKLRLAGRLDEAPPLLELAASRVGRSLEAVLAAVEVVVEGQAEKKPDGSMTFQQLAEKWTTGELHRLYPDHVRQKKTVADDVGRLKLHIYPHVGATPLRDFSLRDAQLVMAELPPTLAANTRRNIALLLNHVLELAVFPTCVIERNPLPRGFAPKAGKLKAHSYLYPDEDAKLMACKNVPLIDRLACGILAREGLRASELRDLAWREVDLERGTIALDINKTDDPRLWVLDPGVVRALRSWKALHPNSQLDDHVLVDGNGASLCLNKLAKRLRQHLLTAKVERSALFQQTDQRLHFRAHDLRGTFVTLALADNKTETWVADRTGHKSSAMINRYRRAARSAAELHLGWLRPLDRLIPELRKGTEKARRLTIAR